MLYTTICTKFSTFDVTFIKFEANNANIKTKQNRTPVKSKYSLLRLKSRKVEK